MKSGRKISKRKLSRKEEDDLKLEIGFMKGIVRRDKTNLEAWRALRHDYYRLKQWENTHHADGMIDLFEPDNPENLYNYARSCSLTKRIRMAAAVLVKALDNGFSDFKWIMKDPDLKNLRSDPLFKEILAKYSISQKFPEMG